MNTNTDVRYPTVPFRQLPLGRVRAGGWLREQLTRNKHGIGGKLPEMEPGMIATPYTTGETEARWGKERKAGWGAEISGNYWTGLTELAFTLDDEELKAKAEAWVNAVLKNQRPDGYMGTYTDEDDLFDDYNAWGTAMGMNAMLAYYSATGRRDVLEAVHRCMLWFCENWAGDRKTRYAGAAITIPMCECFRYTGDRRLVRFCEDYYDFLERNDLFGTSLSAHLSERLHYNSNHGAGYAYDVSHPMEVYLMNGERRYFEASAKAYEKLAAKCIQKTGGVTCESEYLAPLGGTVETEYCAISMLTYSMTRLALADAGIEYCDMTERAVFNAGEGARRKDEKAIAYFHSPNQIFATENSSVADHHHQVYAPCVPVACCPVMSVRLLPEFLRGAVLTDTEEGLWFALYAPLTAEHDGLKVEVRTEYPFRDTLLFRVSAAAPRKKALHFRVPAWCEAGRLSVNGVPAGEAKGGSWACLDREWTDGDEVELVLPMRVTLDRVNDKDRRGAFPMTVEYGPLLFALPIPENWEAWEGVPYTPVPKDFPWYRVTPVVPESKLDVYDNMGMRKYLISWNVALEETLRPEDVRVLLPEQEGYPWERPSVKLRLPARKAPYSYPPYPIRTPEPYGENGRVAVTDRLEIELVPFGCTALRISYFPWAETAGEQPG